MAGERIGEAFVVVRPDTKGFAAEADRNISGSLSKVFSNVVKMAGAAAVAGGAALAGLGAWGLKSAAEMQQVEIAFEGIFQSGVKSKQFLDELRAFAAKTPFEFPELARSAKMLLATGTAADQVIPIMTKLGNVAATLGVGGAEIEGVVRALGQMQGKGKASAEELQQISEQIPGFSAIGAIAKDMGVTVAEAFELMAKGAIPAQRAIDAILAGMDKFPGAAGAMARQSTTLNGVLSTLKDTARDALIGGIAPILPAISASIQGAMPMIQSSLGEIGKLAGSTLQSLLGFADKLLPKLTPLLSLVDRVANVALDELGGVLDAIGPSLDQFVQAFGRFAEIALRALGPALQAILPALIDVGTTLATTWADVLVEISPALQIMAEALAAVVRVIGPAGVSALIAAKAFNAISDAVTGAGAAFKSPGFAVAVGIGVGLAVAWNQLLGATKDYRLTVERLARQDVPQLTAVLAKQVEVHTNANRLWNENNVAFRDTEGRLRVVKALHEQFNDVLKKSPEYGQKFIDTLAAAGRDTDYYSSKLANHVLKQAAGKIASEALSKEIDKQALKFRSAGEQAEYFNGVLTGMIDAQLNAMGATFRALDAVDLYTASVANSDATERQRSQSLVSAQQSLILAAAAAGEAAKKAAEQAGATDGAKRAVEAQTQKLIEFRDTLAPGSSLRVWLDDTIAKLGEWPSKLSTTITISAGGTPEEIAAGLSAGIDPIYFTPKGRAGGGPVRAGTLYRVNEMQREYFRPNVDGSVVPLGNAAAGGDHYEISVSAPTPDPLSLAVQFVQKSRVAMMAARLA